MTKQAHVPQVPLEELGDAEMELFRAEKFGHFESNSVRVCATCNDRIKLMRTVFFPETAETIRMFECDCGERIWDE